MKKDIFILDDNDGSLDDVYVKTKKKEKSAIQTILTKAGFDPNQPRAADGQWGKVSGDTKLEDRPCFKEWFGDSKIVNEDGKPKKVYHGGIGEIEEFDDRYAGDTTGNNEHGAFYFSDDYEVAESYSIQAFNRRYQDNPEGLIEDGYVKELPFQIGDYDEQYAFVEELANDNVNIVSAYMRMENPLIIDADYTTMLRGGVTENIQDIIGVIKGTGFENYPEQLLDYTYDEIDSFDGIIIKNVMDDIGPKSKVYQDVHIAIDSNQIKSVDAKSFCDKTKINKSIADIIFEKAGFNPNQSRDSFGRFGSGEGESESENVNKCKGLLNKNINASDSEGKRGLVKTKDLIPFIGEDRTGTAEMINSKETIKKLKKDITENGFKEPIMLVYDKFSNGGEASILEGNHRMAAAIELNLLEVPVRFEKGTLRSNESREKDRMFPLNRVFIGKLNDTYGVTANDLGLQVRQPNKEDYNNCNKSAIDIILTKAGFKPEQIHKTRV